MWRQDIWFHFCDGFEASKRIRSCIQYICDWNFEWIFHTKPMVTVMLLCTNEFAQVGRKYHFGLPIPIFQSILLGLVWLLHQRFLFSHKNIIKFFLFYTKYKRIVSRISNHVRNEKAREIFNFENLSIIRYI